MGSEHYFTADPESEARLRQFTVKLAGQERLLWTANGVFSPGRIDRGTQVLLDTVPAPPAHGDLLDIGCGWGPICLTLALASPGARVWAVDVNDRALDLVRRNATALGVGNIHAVRPDEVPEDVRFRAIWSNPPIRVGKSILHELLMSWLPRLEADAAAWLVVQRNLGSDSLQRWLKEELGDGYLVDRAATQKGFRVIEARRLR